MGVLEIEQRGRVRRLRLNRAEKLNVFSAQLTDELEGGLRAAMADDDTAVVVLSGAGRAFSAGHDVKSLDDEPEGGGTSTRHQLTDTPKDMVANRRRVDEWLALWSMPKPVIAQVHGYCLGLANELVGCCDLVVCGESAKFGMPEVRQIALFPTLGFWPDRIGMQRTKELLFTGRLVDGNEAVRLGLALECVPDADLEAHVDVLAAHVADVDIDRLTLAKAAVNAWAEARGVVRPRRAARSSTPSTTDRGWCDQFRNVGPAAAHAGRARARRGRARDYPAPHVEAGRGVVFGGQLLAQAIVAAPAPTPTSALVQCTRCSLTVCSPKNPPTSEWSRCTAAATSPASPSAFANPSAVCARSACAPGRRGTGPHPSRTTDASGAHRRSPHGRRRTTRRSGDDHRRRRRHHRPGAEWPAHAADVGPVPRRTRRRDHCALCSPTPPTDGSSPPPCDRTWASARRWRTARSLPGW